MSVYGVRGRKTNEVILHLEEYEAIRLLDYQNLTQEEAAVYMDVSRPTLTRIYEEARNKVATAFVEGRDLISEEVMFILKRTGSNAVVAKPVLAITLRVMKNARFVTPKTSCL